MKLRVLVVALACLSAGNAANAQTIVAAPPHTANFDGFIVTEGDISDRPYAELGTVTAKAGKFSWVSRNPDRSDIELPNATKNKLFPIIRARPCPRFRRSVLERRDRRVG
jgi:hypothetical protein